MRLGKFSIDVEIAEMASRLGNMDVQSATSTRVIERLKLFKQVGTGVSVELWNNDLISPVAAMHSSLTIATFLVQESE